MDDPVRVDDPATVKLISVRLHGKGAVQRTIGDGKAPKPFIGNRGRAGQFVFSRIWARRGAMAVIPAELDGVVVTNEFPIFEIDRSTLNPTFLSFFVQTPRFRRELERISAGASGQNRVKEASFLALDLAIPSLDEQRRIAAILDAADVIRAKREATLARLDALRLALFVDMFGGLEASVPFGELISDGPTNGLYKPAADYGSGSPILRIDSFDAGVIHAERWQRVRLSESETSRFGLQAGDIIINRVNALSHLGKSALVRRLEEPSVYESNMMRLRVDSGKVLPGFIVAWMQTDSYKRQVLRKAKKAINQASINQTDVRSLMLAVPTLDSQRTFAARAERIDAQRDAVQRALAADDELFASLQSRAFSGKL
ncbi:hypothetical protein ACF1AJ_15465 [Leifsonia sp. NPDC014704]|uniref:restriction endonuclease subunit S n=1 Tax=Leifsonia sp. NPDC014704 TaxID=3364123 RepID=UPI0036F4A03A